MSSTYSNSLRVELIGSGDQAGTWGTTTDNNFAYIFDTAIAGYQTVSIAASSQALTYVNGPTSTAALNQSIYAMLRLTTSTSANFAVYAPPVSKTYIIYNNSGYTATIYNSTVIGNTTAAGTGIAITDGNKVLVFSDGTNFYTINAANLTGTLAIANGGTGQTTQQAALNALAGTQTNNRVLRSDGTNTTLSQVNVATDVTGTLAVTNGGTGVTTSTGSGNNVLSTSPTLVTPALGAPTSGDFSTGTFTWPTFNQNTTGSAGSLSATLPINKGGTGQTTAALAGSALGAIGIGQTWTNVTSSRAIGTTYTNSTGRPIMIAVTMQFPNSANAYVSFSINGSIVGYSGVNSAAQPAILITNTYIIPDTATYLVTTQVGSPSINNWWELR